MKLTNTYTDAPTHTHEDAYTGLNLRGKATLKENIIKMKDILFPNILVQVS